MTLESFARRRRVYLSSRIERKVGGSPVATFDAYGAATGDRWTTATFGQASLSGSVEFTLECKGKSASSAGHDLKIDHIELVPVDGGGSSGGPGAGRRGIGDGTGILVDGDEYGMACSQELGAGRENHGRA
ncbi:hypothetical protein [Sorangium sp. So ce854]|uniref:hypothetical protein n=1 Tax=Sorangium sp. So ce854 TaxID=3133322 RepID=UPI003F5DECEA